MKLATALIVPLAAMAADTALTVKLGLQTMGIFVPPLGVVLGWLI